MGIGYAITKDIADSGGNVAVLDLRNEPLEDVHGLARENVKVSYHQCDVSNEQSLKSGFEQAVQALGSIDGIVTAAGIAIDKPFVDQKWEEVDKVIQVNVSFYPSLWAPRRTRLTCAVIIGHGLFLRSTIGRGPDAKAGHAR